MHISWDGIQLLLALAEGGSVSAAARRLGITQPTASRRLAQLEAEVGERLFERSVEGVQLTALGERIVAPATRMAELAGEVTRTLEGRDVRPEGAVRITAPPGMAFEHLVPFAERLRSKLPAVSLQILANVQTLDLARREADLALRMTPPTGDLLTLASVDLEVGVFAAPRYKASLPRGATLRDLAWIGWAPPYEDVSPMPELRRLVPGFVPAFTADDFLVQMRAAVAGLGVMVLGTPVGQKTVADGALVALDVGLPRMTRALTLVCAKSSLDIPRVRAVADLLAAELATKSEPPAGATVPRRTRHRPR